MKFSLFFFVLTILFHFSICVPKCQYLAHECYPPVFMQVPIAFQSPIEDLSAYNNPKPDNTDKAFCCPGLICAYSFLNMKATCVKSGTLGMKCKTNEDCLINSHNVFGAECEKDVSLCLPKDLKCGRLDAECEKDPCCPGFECKKFEKPCKKKEKESKANAHKSKIILKSKSKNIKIFAKNEHKGLNLIHFLSHQRFKRKLKEVMIIEGEKPKDPDSEEEDPAEEKLSPEEKKRLMEKNGVINLAETPWFVKEECSQDPKDKIKMSTEEDEMRIKKKSKKGGKTSNAAKGGNDKDKNGKGSGKDDGLDKNKDGKGGKSDLDKDGKNGKGSGKDGKGNGNGNGKDGKDGKGNGKNGKGSFGDNGKNGKNSGDGSDSNSKNKNNDGSDSSNGKNGNSSNSSNNGSDKNGNGNGNGNGNNNENGNDKNNKDGKGNGNDKNGNGNGNNGNNGKNGNGDSKGGDGSNGDKSSFSNKDGDGSESGIKKKVGIHYCEKMQ